MMRRNIDELVNAIKENGGKLTDVIDNDLKVVYSTSRSFVIIRMIYRDTSIYINNINTNDDINKINSSLTFMYHAMENAIYKINNYTDTLYEMTVAEKIFIAWAARVNADNHTCVSSNTLTIYE